MSSRRSARARLGVATGLVCASVGTFAALAAPAAAAPKLGFQGEHGRLADKDARTGAVAPTDAQKARAAQLGATVRWNRFGTPRSLSKVSGTIASGLSSSDPVAAGRAFLKANLGLFKLTSAAVDGLEVAALNKVGDGYTVLFRQKLGGLRALDGGLIAIALHRGSVLYVTSSNTGNLAAPGAASLSPTAAWLKAAADVGKTFAAGDISNVRTKDGWTTFKVKGMEAEQRARLMALPTYTNGNRSVFETIVLDAKGGDHGPEGFTILVDAQSGAVWTRTDRVNFLADNPRWEVFPANPSLELQNPKPPENPTLNQTAIYRLSDEDTRQTWCWQALTAAQRSDPTIAKCDRVLFNEQPRRPQNGEWDRAYDPVGDSVATSTSVGNNADSTQARLSPLTGGTPGEFKYASPSRDYIFPWQNRWNAAACNQSEVAVPGQGADVSAAIANLFAMHNRMHDWSYFLGFREETWNMQQYNFGHSTGPAATVVREGDPERGGVQAGAITGGPPSFLGRDNANQITLNDGIPGITNMYLWQPIQAAFYAPCVDGDFDMSVIGHEYTHAISNRMVAGPDGGLTGRQARSMGESWSDLVAVEYLNEYGFVPTNDENPFAVGPYVTGDKQAGIRNYGMNDSPLNWSNIGYDVTGPQVHADGEIWSATNHELRQAFIARYGAGSRSLQDACANGRLPYENCPGNRRWVAILFHAFLLMQPDVDMADARDAFLTADRQLFGTRRIGSRTTGANADIMWRVFAHRGLGALAENQDSRDGDSEEIPDRREADPEPGFNMPEIPFGNQNATVTFNPTAGDGVAPKDVRIFVGDYEARSTPYADTITGEDDPGRDRPRTRPFAPGTYQFTAMAPGFGHVKFTRTFKPSQKVTVSFPMFQNIASKSNGATATGGTNPQNLLDDTEDTQWQGNGVPSTQRVTVALDNAPGGAAPGTQPFNVKRVRVSALLRPARGTTSDPTDMDPSQSRFAALRAFEIWTCDKGAACTDADYTKAYESPADAFPSRRPRPRAPELNIRSFDIPDTTATHVQLRVVHNQCTGTPGYHGEQDADPFNTTDCRSGAVAATRTFAAELQVLKGAAGF